MAGIPKCHDAVLTGADGFKHLQLHVATSAFDSADSVDARKCHPDTRTAVLREISSWIAQAPLQIQRILWLNGAAGAGKSALARSTVQYCLDNGIPIARLFFFRSDPARNGVDPVIATLVVQLMETFPDLHPIIIPAINADPLIFMKSFEMQFKVLIFEPLRQLKYTSHAHATLVLLFDGVDECADRSAQTRLIRTMSDCSRKCDYPALAFFASRAEPQLHIAFREPCITDSLCTISLDENYAPATDIRRFVDASFAHIRMTHHLSHTLGAAWPPRGAAETIVGRSSGQFIFASVCMHFISTPEASPAAQLNIVLGLRPVVASNPFAPLDALYIHILSHAARTQNTLLVLAWALFSVSGSLDISQCGYTLSMDTADVYAALAPLTAVLSCMHGPRGTMRFLHASLPDFLCDRTRAGAYYMDRGIWCTRIAGISIRRMGLPLGGRAAHAKYLECEGVYICQANAARAIGKRIFSLDVEYMLPRVYNERWLSAYLRCISNSVCIYLGCQLL